MIQLSKAPYEIQINGDYTVKIVRSAWTEAVEVHIMTLEVLIVHGPMSELAAASLITSLEAQRKLNVVIGT